MLLSKISRAIPRVLFNSSTRAFGGGSGHGHGHAPKPITDDLSPQDMDKYDFLTGARVKEESTFALHNVVSKNPLTKSKEFLSFFAESFGEAKTESNTEHFVPPKVHENSVFLYQAAELSTSVRKLRSLEGLGLFTTVFFMHQPTFVIPTFAAFYIIYGNAFFYELSRRLVTRMDLLPHLEMIQVEKVSAFGLTSTKLIRIDDLEKIDFAIAENKENFFWGLNKTNVDPNLIFRVKSTKEYLCFDRCGYWDWKGISHQLLN